MGYGREQTTALWAWNANSREDIGEAGGEAAGRVRGEGDSGRDSTSETESDSHATGAHIAIVCVTRATPPTRAIFIQHHPSCLDTLNQFLHCLSLVLPMYSCPATSAECGRRHMFLINI